MARWLVNHSQLLRGKIQVPGDKSISHRSIMFGALAIGKTTVKGLLLSRDVFSTINAFRQMGVNISSSLDDELMIQGVGLKGLSAVDGPINMGNSGTSMRLLSGVLVGQKFDTTLIGDESLSKRPMNRIIKPLREMGANISGDDHGFPPLNIKGNNQLESIDITLDVASAQVKSAILLAGLYANGKTIVTEPIKTRDHTENLLIEFAGHIQREQNSIAVEGKQTLKACNVIIPGDISSAAFWLVAASLIKNSDVVLTNVNINPTRVGIITVLQRMGADISMQNQQIISGELVADLRVKSASLQATMINKDEIPSCIDELPILFVAAALANGETTISGAEELRVKETDRLQVMSNGLKKMGVNIMEKQDGVVIQGSDQLLVAEVDAQNDHRCAMAFAVAASLAKQISCIKNCEYVDVSYPNFIEHMTMLGGRINLHDG